MTGAATIGNMIINLLTMERFFKPFVGANYQQGIRGKKILVLGASFYCDVVGCPHFGKCTDTSIKDSSIYNNCCPPYQKYGIPLSENPTYAIEDGNTTYQRFATWMAQYAGTDDYDTIWSQLAFTNYVQFMLPAAPGHFRDTRWSDLSERDFHAFIETLRELQPDIVIILGSVINSRLKEKNEYLVSADTLRETEYYICQLSVPGVEHTVTLINPYHPSSSAWYGDLEKFNHYFKTLLK